MVLSGLDVLKKCPTVPRPGAAALVLDILFNKEE